MQGSIGKRNARRVRGLMLRMGVFLLCTWVTLGTTAAAAEPPAQNRTTTPTTADGQQQKESLARLQRLIQEANQLAASGKTVEAIAAWEKVAVSAPPVVGDVSEVMANVNEWLAYLQEQRGAWPAARKSRENVLTIRGKLFGEKDWRVTDARLAVQNVDVLSR